MATLAGGSRAALGELYDRYGDRAYAVAIAICRDQPRAQEVVVELFGEVWRSRASYQPPTGTVAAWLLVSVRSRTIALTRWTIAPTDPGRARGPAAQAAQTGDSGNDADRLHEQLAQLPDAEHEVITLACYGRLSHGDIAAQLGLGPEVVKARMRLGMHQLSRSLEATIA